MAIPRDFTKQLNAVLDKVFIESDDRGWAWTKLAKIAGLSYGTVHRLGWRKTKRPHFLSVWKLAKAVGMEFQLVAIKAKLRKAS